MRPTYAKNNTSPAVPDACGRTKSWEAPSIVAAVTQITRWVRGRQTKSRLYHNQTAVLLHTLRPPAGGEETQKKV